MNLDRDDIEREEILYRYFREELTSEERTEVEDWCALSSENQQLFDVSKILFLDLKGLAYYENLELQEVDQSWERFKNDKKIRYMRPPSPGPYALLKYAASILLVVSTILVIYYYQNRTQTVTIASTDQVQEVMLSEGSVITINEGGGLEYLEPFQDYERRLELTGEAYFDVTQMPHTPFVVETSGAEVRVLGTKFYINKPDEKRMNVQVDEGKVLLSYKDLHRIVEAGESITLDLENKRLSEIEDTIGVTSFWKTRRLIFRLTSLSDVIDIINEAYGSSVRLEGSSEGCALTVTFDNEEFGRVLEVISSTLNYELTQDQGTYILKGNGCQ